MRESTHTWRQRNTYTDFSAGSVRASGRIQVPGIVSNTRAHTAAEYLFLPWTLTTCRAFFMLS